MPSHPLRSIPGRWVALLLMLGSIGATSSEPYRPHPDRQLVVFERVDSSRPTQLVVHLTAPDTSKRVTVGFVGALADKSGRVTSANEGQVFGLDGATPPVVWANGSSLEPCDVPDPCHQPSPGFYSVALGHTDGGGAEATTNRYYVWIIGEKVRITVRDGSDEWRARHVDPTSVISEVHTYDSLSAGGQVDNVGVETFVAASLETDSVHTLALGVAPCVPYGVVSPGAGVWSLFGGSTIARRVCPADPWAPTAVAHEPTEWLFEGAGAGPTTATGRHRLVVLDLANIARQLG